MNKEEMLDNIFQKYYDNLKPFLATVEARLEIFPEGILNEIRALFDHVARIGFNELNDEEKLEELKTAKRHINRAVFDCYKVLCAHEEERIEKFLEDYKGIRLGEVDSGKFLPEFTRLSDRARELVDKAKEYEKYGSSRHEKASEKFQEAIVEYNDLRKYIALQSQNLAWSASHQRKEFWKGKILAFAMGIVTTIIGTLICDYFDLI